MVKILILGASGQIARHVVDMLVSRDDAELTLFQRDAGKLSRDVAVMPASLKATFTTLPN